jgi:hypothetical protein
MRGNKPRIDPWYDYLAFPVAPIVLVVQIAALFLRPAWVRVGLSIAATASIYAMAAYIWSLPDRPGEGVNIGAGILVLWLLASIGLLGVGVVREVVPLALRTLRGTRSAGPGQGRT